MAPYSTKLHGHGDCHMEPLPTCTYATYLQHRYKQCTVICYEYSEEATTKDYTNLRRSFKQSPDIIIDSNNICDDSKDSILSNWKKQTNLYYILAGPKIGKRKY